MKKPAPAPTEINVAPMTNTNSVILTYLDRDKIFMNPAYQRFGNIWSEEKKQLLIDSVINRFDIPKLYFHEFQEPKLIEGKKRRYAVIDGKQRLLAIWDFINNTFSLPDKFEYLPEPTLDLSNLTYAELAKSHPQVKALFDNYPLTIMVVRTEDVELIEDMFSRLNEAVPLNAAEKRNAFGGPFPPLIRKLAEQPFFKTNLPFANTRYRHFDLACKFLYLCHMKSPADTKKIKLDEFVRAFQKTNDVTTAKRLDAEVKRTIAKMSAVFTAKDYLLKNIGDLVAYFLIFRVAVDNGEIGKITRKRFVEFEDAREKNSITAAKDIKKADYELLKLDELSSTVNDEYAIRFRCELICRRALIGLTETVKAFQAKA
jgi:hypothetical protein